MPDSETSASPSRVTAAALITLLFLLSFFWPGFDSSIFEMDEGLLLTYPEQISHHRLPYRDFETFYTPGNLYTLTGAYELFGFSIGVERTMGLLYRLAILAALFVIGTRRNLAIAIAATALAAMVMKLTYLAAFAWWGGVAFGLWALVVLGSKLRYRALIGGLLASFALLYRQDLGPALILGSLPLWFTLSTRGRIIYFAAAATSLIALVVLGSFVGYRALVDNLFTYPVLITNAGRRLPISHSHPSLIALFAVHLMALLCNLVDAFLTRADDQHRDQWTMRFALALFALGITPQAIQRFDAVHLSFAAFASLALLPSSVHIIFDRIGVFRNPRTLNFAAVGAAIAVVCAIILPDAALRKAYSPSARVSSLPLRIREREVPIGNNTKIRQFTVMGALLEKYADPGEKLFVGPGDLRRTCANDAFLYHLFPWLQPASYFMEMNPFSANRVDSRLSADLEQADWLILNRHYDAWNEPNASKIFGPDKPNKVIEDLFVQRAEIGTFRLLERRTKVSRWPVNP